MILILPNEFELYFCPRSPLGYEHYDEVTITRQVVIGGKNKYLINGSNVQNNRVQDFFRSVQLNVNNPHVLIMQGRITKVSHNLSSPFCYLTKLPLRFST